MSAHAPATAPVTPPGTIPKVSESWLSEIWGVFNKEILGRIDKSLLQSLPEVGHLSPIIFTFGSFFIALVTLNYPLFILGLSSTEAYLAYMAIGGVADLTATPFSGLKTKEDKPACRSFFQGLSPSRFEYFMKRGLLKEFPNTPLYFICFAVAYCIQSMFFFSEECSELGPSYSNRIYLSLLAAGMFIVLYTTYLVAYGCDNLFSLVPTIIIGLLVGYFICYQNYLLLGKTSVDLLFIPPLAKRNGMDYLCVSTNAPSS